MKLIPAGIAVCLTTLVMNFTAKAAEPVEIPLWADIAPAHRAKVEVSETLEGTLIKDVTQPTLTIYSPAPEKNTGRAVVVCPGGGYALLAFSHEGTQYARWLADNGITAALLKYRMPYGVKEIPAEDAERAFELLHSEAAELGINPDKIGIMGFSAGGHLASTITVHGTGAARPAFSILMYPVISMDRTLTHGGSRTNLLGKDAPEADVLHYSNDLHINANTPPTLLMASADDTVVNPENTIRFYRALRANKVPAAMYIFPEGGHGWGFKPGFKYHEPMKALLLAWINDR